MKPRITVLTLGVDDLEKAVAFYRDGLGWQTAGIVGKEFEHGAVAFFQLSSGVQLALWARDDIAHDTGLTKSARSPTEFTLGHNVNSAQEVDAAMARAQKAGARLIKKADKTFYGGYAGYFADPDGHVWEVVWNPQLKITD
jgi:catechol 2,3-dioxygenase-like lactoylglutathione lyase family enzyme